MLLFAIISIMALPRALGGLIPTQVSTNDAGQLHPSISFTEVDCKGTLITPGGNDMDNRDCMKEASAKSIAAINRGEGGEYCLLRFQDGNCENLENSQFVKLEQGGGDQCVTLTDGYYGSYSWIKTSGNNCPTGRSA